MEKAQPPSPQRSSSSVATREKPTAGAAAGNVTGSAVEGAQTPPSVGTTGGVACVWLAAGSGTRMGNRVNKVFLPLSGRAVVTRSIQATLGLAGVTERILVVAQQDMVAAQELLAEALPFRMRYVTGGSSRHESESNALRALAPEIEAGRVDIVVVHDAARPLAAPELFAAVVEMARKHGGALPVRPSPPLVASEPAATTFAAPNEVVTVQTPQAFRARPLLEAHRKAAEAGFVGTDTASCIERFSRLEVKSVPGNDANLKITYAEDLVLAERLLAGSR